MIQNRIFITTLAVVSIFLAFAVSCSNSTAPAVPDLVQPQNTGQTFRTASNRVLFGAWDITINENHSSYELTPLRIASGHFNIRTFLEDNICTNCLSVVGFVNQGNGVLDFDVRITHPFIGLDQFTGFDVRGIVIFPQTGTWPVSGLSWSEISEGGGGLLNPDGWTTLFNPVDFPQGSGLNIFTYNKGKLATNLADPSRLNPFKAYYMEPNRRPFFTSEAITKKFSIKVPQGGFQFGYVVDASWEKATPNPPVNIPEDFPKEANSLEAYRIDVEIDEGLDSYGGIVECRIEIFDWQGTSTVSSVSIEAPDLFDGSVTASLDTDYGTISHWSCLVQNLNEAPEGDYPVLVRIDDTGSDLILGSLSAFTIVSAHVDEGIPLPEGIYVDRDYPGLAEGLPEDGTPEFPFNSIAEAMLVMQAGQKIYIDPSPGPYNEQVVLRSNAVVIGDNWNNDGDYGLPVIEAMDFGVSVYGKKIDNIFIENLEIRPGGDLTEEYLFGILIEYNDDDSHNQNITVRKCLFTGDRVHTGDNTGDEVICAEINHFDNVLFEENEVRDVYVGSDQGGYFSPLHIDICDGVIVRKNWFHDCITKNSFLGMRIWFSDLPVLVEDNDLGPITNSDTPTGFTIGWGINVIGYSDVTVKHNYVHDFGSPGHRIETIPLFFRVSGNGSYTNWIIENNLLVNMHSQDYTNTTNSADCRGIMFRMNTQNSLDGLSISNNTVVNLESGEYVTGLEFDIGSSSNLTNYKLENNIFKDIRGPELPDSYETSAAVYAYWPSGDLTLEYDLFDNIQIPDPMFVGTVEGEGVIVDEDPLFDSNYGFPLNSPAQLGNPYFLDFDDLGPASGDPANTDPATRSRMGAYGGPEGDW